MAKMTNKDKSDKIAAKKAAEKAKKAAKRAARLEKKRKQAEAKKAKREAKKAKKLAKLEKEKAKKLALKEKKRLAKEKAKEKQAALKTAKIDKPTAKPIDGIDIKEAAKTIKAALNQIAAQMALLPKDKRIKKAKSIYWMGYDVETVDGNVIVHFYPEKSKKSKLDDAIIDQLKKTTDTVEKPDSIAVDTVVDDSDSGVEDEPKSVETVPMGDLYGQGGVAVDDGEVANLDDDDNAEDDILDDDDDNDDDNANDDDDDADDTDDTISDSRDEQDTDLIDHRAEFFSQYGDDFEPNDD